MNEQGTTERRYRVRVDAITPDADRDSVHRLLLRLAPKADPAKLRARLDKTPFWLNRQPISQDAAGKLAKACQARGLEVSLITASLSSDTEAANQPVAAQPVEPETPPEPDHNTSPNWTRSALLGVLLLLVAGIAGYWHLFTDAPSFEPARLADPINEQPSGPPPLPAYLKQWRQAYWPPPDSRFLQGLHLLQQIEAGKPLPKPTVERIDNGWMLTGGNGRRHKLLPFQGFAETWTRLLQGRKKPPKSDQSAHVGKKLLSDFWAPSQLQLLQQLGADGPLFRDGRSCAAGATALVNLALQTQRYTDARDPLLAHAFALALRAEAGGIDVTETKALLAWLMGYEIDAEQFAAGLPADHPIRVLTSSREPNLLPSALAPDSPPRHRYLALLLASRDSHSTQEWAERVKQLFPEPAYPLAILNTGLNTQHFELSRELPGAVLANLIEQTQLPEPAAGQTDSGLVARWEQAHPPLDGHEPFSPAHLRQQYLDQNFWGAIIQSAAFRLYSLGSLDATAALIPQLAGRSERARQFTTWLQHSVAQRRGELPADDFSRQISGYDQLPWNYLLASYRELRKRFDLYSPVLRRTLRQLALLGDERPSRLGSLGQEIGASLREERRKKTLFSASVAAAPYSQAGRQLWLIWDRLEQAEIAAIMRDPDQSPVARLRAFAYLTAVGAEDAEQARPFFDELIAQDPDDWLLISQAVEYFERDDPERLFHIRPLPESAQTAGPEQYRLALSLLDDWMENHDESMGFNWLEVNEVKSRLLRKLNRGAEAWELIRPLAESMRFKTLQEAARAALAVDEFDQARGLAERAYQRYPDSLNAALLLAEMAWREGDFGHAGRLLAEHRPKISTVNWRWTVAERLMQTLADQPPERIQQALAEIAAASPSPHDLLQLAHGIDQSGSPEPAVWLATQQQDSNSYLGDMDLKVRTFGMLEELRGREAALEWLKGRMNYSQRNRFSLALFAHKHYALLWDYIQEPDPNQYPEMVWLLRAVAALKEGLAQHPHRDQLLAYYQDQGHASWYDQIGRHMLDMISQDDIIAIAGNHKQAIELGFYLGFKAEAEGRLDEAEDWYQTTVENSESRITERRWAVDWLWRRKFRQP